MSVPTPSTGQKISDFSAGNVDANSYFIQANSGSTSKVSASQIGQFSNLNLLFSGAGGLDTTAKTIVGAINEVNGKEAEDIPYDNTASEMTATNVQAAIDEIVDDGYYHVGDTMSLLRTGMVAYGGASNLYFTIPLDKPIGNDVTDFSLTGSWRCILTNGSSLVSSVVLDNAALSTLGTVTYSKASNGVRVSIALASSLGSWSLGTIVGTSSDILTFS